MKTAQWSQDEKIKLQKLYKLYKRVWSIIAKELSKEFNNNRTIAQCRYQFNKINKEWKQKDKELLIFKRLQGIEWSEIAYLFPGRKEIQLKAKYNQLINTEIYERINKQLKKEYNQEIQIKSVKQVLTMEKIASLKYKHIQTPHLQNFDIITSSRKEILNEFNV